MFEKVALAVSVKEFLSSGIVFIVAVAWTHNPVAGLCLAIFPGALVWWLQLDTSFLKAMLLYVICNLIALPIVYLFYVAVVVGIFMAATR